MGKWTFAAPQKIKHLRCQKSFSWSFQGKSFRILLIGLDRWIYPFLRHFNNHHEKVTLRKIKQLMRKKLCGKNRRISLTNFAIRIFHKMKDGRGRRLLQNFKVIIHYFSSFEKMMRNCSRISFWLQKWLKHSLIL